MKTLFSPFWALSAALAAASLFTAPAAAAGKHSGKPHRGGGADIVRINCASGDYRRTYCHVPGYLDARSATLANLKSNASCEAGRDWGLIGDKIWVDNGCRGEFDVSSRRNAFSGWNVAYADGGYGSRPKAHKDRDLRGTPVYETVSYRGGGGYGVSRREARQAIAACSRAANEYAWDRGAFSAQYKGLPEVVIGRKGALRVRGIVRTQRYKGYRTAQTLCVTRDGHVRRYERVG